MTLFLSLMLMFVAGCTMVDRTMIEFAGDTEEPTQFIKVVTQFQDNNWIGFDQLVFWEQECHGYNKSIEEEDLTIRDVWACSKPKGKDYAQNSSASHLLGNAFIAGGLTGLGFGIGSGTDVTNFNGGNSSATSMQAQRLGFGRYGHYGY